MSTSSLLRSAVVLAASALLLAGCAPAPETTETASDYCARMVTNSGGLEDRSFNQSSWEGLEKAKTDLSIDAEVIVSTNETDLAPNVTQAVDSGCQFILTVGYELADATTAEAAFLAGYLAAGTSATGKVATFGGGNQPPVTLFMDGFVDGVAKYNEVHGTAVQALGWNKDAQDGVFTGDFEDINKGKVTTQAFIDQGADVILPVAGQVGEGAAAAALENPNVSIIWVDNDGYETLPSSYKPIILTSVLKNTGDAVVQIVGDDLDGSFENTPFVGTLENGGVELAPYHDKAAAVTPELQAELDGLKSDIVSGALEVTSPSTP
jgi:basic membrane protein A